MTSKLRSKPPSTSAAEFISGAHQRTAEMEQNETLQLQESRQSKPRRMLVASVISAPWEDPQVRDDVLKVYNLRLPEPYLLKLKYIAAHTPDSMHQFCIGVLLPAIDKKVEELADLSGGEKISTSRGKDN